MTRDQARSPSPSSSSPIPNTSQAPILLPLLPCPSSAPNSHRPPLHLLLNGTASPPRIVFTSRSRDTEWISTNHVFPSAYPRSHTHSTAPPAEPQPEPSVGTVKGGGARHELDLKEWDRIKTNPELDIRSHFPPNAQEEAQQRAHEYAARAYPQLWSTVQRIVPVRKHTSSQERPGEEHEVESYTLLLAHANGFHKETWEPILPHLIEALEAAQQETSGKRSSIDEVWSLDTFGSGESGTLNRHVLGETASWFDGARDIVQFIKNYLPPSAKGNSSRFGPRWHDTQLKYCRASDVSPNKTKGRKIIGVGHSFSGAALSILAGAEPDLLDGLILVDPVMFHPDNFSSFVNIKYTNLDHPAASKAVIRRDVWSTRSEASQYFLSRPFWKAWDPLAAKLYARFAVRPIFPSISPWQVQPHSNDDDSVPNPNTAIAWTLAMSKWSEAAFFATSALGVFGLAALKHGKFKGKVHHFVMTQTVQSEKDTQAIAACIEEKYAGKTEVLQGDHLVVQQQPQLIGERLAKALVNMFGTRSSFATPSARL